ncbi:ABC transporter substrate-binding protein [Agrococcus terreus]|uniref:ABC transporter substrate-binding protein n=1 Tax=Agrococcus terreus TaxID=574649 RepID=UPI00384AEB65
MLRTSIALAASALVVALAGCSAAAPAATPAASDGATPGTSADGTAPIVDCGIEVAPRAEPAERIVAVKSTAADLVAALGLGDALISTAFLDAEPEDAAVAAAPTIEGMPGREALLALEPDAVVAGWESAFAPEAAGDRASLHALGITTWVSPAACRSTDVEPLTWDALLHELEQAGAALGVPEAGAELAAEQRAALDRVQPVEDAPTALWYSSGEDAPYVGGGSGAPALVLDTAGLENVAADVDEAWTTMSWEAVAAADPDVIVLVDAAWHSAESKLERLRANPATAQLRAVQEERVVVVPFPMAEAGVGSVAAAQLVADAVRDLG